MPFIVITGHGSWTPAPGMRFEAGVHEVTAEVAAKAQARGMAVYNEPPEIEEHGDGPLRPEHIKRGVRGVQVARPEEEEEVETPEEIEQMRHFDCPHCPMGFASMAARDRHLDRAHEAGEGDWQPEPEEAEPTLAPEAVDSAFGPGGGDGGLHPSEADPPGQ